ncbi:MAG: class I SAM-dependent methyltransferase, partial [Hyphomicrobiales bacterium]|nr:class I SAM-dependent methyltransferase [Hyphomicrobiales bacterium]
MTRTRLSNLSPANGQQCFPADVPSLVRKVLAPTTRLRAGSLVVTLPDGRKVHLESHAAGPQAELVIKDYHFARRLLMAGEIGFGEGYLQGEWESPHLETLIELMSVNRRVLDEIMPGRFAQRMLQLLAHMLHRNTRSGARQNIRAHYDLGNVFYQTWLDQTMTYSSAVFAPGDNDLAAAQERKYRLLAERAGVRPGESVLEIGCGWGGFAEFAARELGCKVTGLTISKEQFEFATERMQKAGLADRVTIALRDYRDERGTFDRIVSIEMFEAVGEGFWPGFFRQMRERLRPGGTAGLQVITIAE